MHRDLPERWLAASHGDLVYAREHQLTRHRIEAVVIGSDSDRLARGETVRLEVRDGLKPGVVKGESDEFTYLVMPVRLPTPVG